MGRAPSDRRAQCVAWLYLGGIAHYKGLPLSMGTDPVASEQSVQNAALPGKGCYPEPELIQVPVSKDRERGRAVETPLPVVDQSRSRRDFTAAVTILGDLERPGRGA